MAASMPLRRGTHAALEAEANRLIRESLRGVTKHSEKADILTPWKEAERYRREVYVASGTPDAATRRGNFHRVTNSARPELNCLAGETEVVVRDQGLVSIADLAGTTHEIYTSKGWGKGEFASFGEQSVQQIIVTRYGAEKMLSATASHRWFVHGEGQGFYQSGARKGNPYPQAHCRSVVQEVVTADLQVGQNLVTKMPPRLTGQTTPSSFGIAHGFTYGDGSRVTNRRGAEGGTFVDLFGEKDLCLLPFFPNPKLAYYPRPEVAVDTVRIVGLPGFFKRLPDPNESVPYLYGWLAGYFAADGDVNSRGHCRLTSHSLANMMFVRNICYRLGIVVSAPTRTFGVNALTGRPHEMFAISIDKWSLSESFFCINAHRDRWVKVTRSGRPNVRENWVVRSVEQTDRIEEVFCAVVPSTQDFLLGDYILTGNSRSGIARPRRSMGNGLQTFVSEHNDPEAS